MIASGTEPPSVSRCISGERITIPPEGGLGFPKCPALGGDHDNFTPDNLWDALRRDTDRNHSILTGYCGEEGQRTVPGSTGEKAYEKHAWILLFALGVGTALFAVGAFAQGGDFGVFPDTREFGVAVLGWSIFILALSGVSYRRGERWAWYAFWYLPVAFAVLAAHDLSVGGSKGQFVAMPLLFLAISLLGLLLPYRKFFPQQRVPAG